MAKSRDLERSRLERWTFPAVGLGMVLTGLSLVIDEDDIDIRALGLLAVVLGALEIGIGVVMWRQELRSPKAGEEPT